MEGKVCLVTGATAGIGEATALGLARAGATVLLVARNPAKAEEVLARLAAESGNPRLEVLLADLASLAQVRALAAEVERRHDRLHVLVNNAAVYTKERALTADGIETQFAVNHLAPFLLTNLLLPLLRRSAPARVVTVSSEAHRGITIDWENLTGERRYHGLRAYGQSKLANLLFTFELARRLSGSGVTANAVHPGVVGTSLLFGGWAPLRLLKPFLRGPEQGARTTVFLATSPRVEGVTGRYYKDSREIEPSPQARDPETARRLWEISERMTGLA